ncbi:MAG: hypothetical protein JJU36_01870 [Phycisphaeraceae bacterium]|nr:hypothetical protein [Phycisphaeraceae bacterium]
MHQRLFLTLAFVITLMLPAASSRGDATNSDTTPIHYKLILEDALIREDVAPRRVLVVDLERVGDHWGAAYGVARDYNMAFHRGAVKKAETTAGGLRIELLMNFTGDQWVPGGEGQYRIELKRDEDGALSGTYEGTFRGRTVEGAARGSAYAPQVDPNHRAIEPGEYPRLLFRKEDLPALREKFQTPFGQKAKQRLEAAATPPAYGLLYQLTGDRSYVDKGLELARQELRRPHRGGAFRPLGELGDRLERLAVFYDLAHDALPEDYKADYRAWVGDLGSRVYFTPGTLGNTNWHVVSNHVADVYAGITMSALLLHDLPADAPEEPSTPFLDEVLPPAPDDFHPGDDVPVVALTPGRSPDRWLHTEPLRQITPDDPRVVFYGLETVHPRPGAKVEVGEFEMTFREQDPALRVTADDQYGGMRVYDLLDADAASRLRQPFTMVGYTVIEVKEPGKFILSAPCSLANVMQVALNGRLLADGQVVRLEKGLYPLMVKVQWRMRWGHIAPSLSPATDEQIERWEQRTRELREQYATRKLAYENALATWKRTGGDPAFARMLRISRFVSALHNTHAVGRGGFQGEVSHYSMEAMIGHARLWPAWRRVMGYDITPGNEYPDVIPRKIVGGPQDINGTTRIGGNYFAALLPTIRPQWQPEVLTAWKQEARERNLDLRTDALREDPVRGFVNFPLDMEPAPLGTHLPRQWQAPDFGYYVLRSGWGEDAFVAQVFLKSMIISGWHGQNAGTYRLRGLDVNWAQGPTDRVRRRQEENVVWMPESELWDAGTARLTHLHTDEHTLIISADMNKVYERGGRLAIAPYGHVIRPRTDDEAAESSGITGMRAMAFDFSGASGAPCLFVLVDRIDGGEGHRRLWLYQPPIPQGKRMADVVKAMDLGRFMVRPADEGPSLRGAFAHPRDAQVLAEPLRYEYVKTWGQGRGGTHEVNVNATSVSGEDHFFFVGTVVKDGEHPRITIEGQGLDAVITVGDRIIRFDGEKIILTDR